MVKKGGAAQQGPRSRRRPLCAQWQHRATGGGAAARGGPAPTRACRCRAAQNRSLRAAPTYGRRCCKPGRHPRHVWPRITNAPLFVEAIRRHYDSTPHGWSPAAQLGSHEGLLREGRWQAWRAVASRDVSSLDKDVRGFIVGAPGRLLGSGRFRHLPTPPSSAVTQWRARLITQWRAMAEPRLPDHSWLGAASCSRGGVTVHSYTVVVSWSIPPPLLV